MEYRRTLRSAMEFAENGKIEEWIHAFLLSDGCNVEFSQGLKREKRYFFGPVELPLSLFCRNTGPEQGMKYRTDQAGFEQRVGRLEERILLHADLPPLIVNYSGGVFEMNDGNHRLEAFRRLGVEKYFVVVWCTDPGEQREFCRRIQSLSTEFAERL